MFNNAIVIPRLLAPRLNHLLETHSAVALLGPRQVGKTTLAREIAMGRPSVYLDLERADDLAKLANPAEYFRLNMNKLVILDEVQRRPELFKELRGAIDEARHSGLPTGRYLILGSASHDLLQQSSESLAGRIIYETLAGISPRELQKTDITLNTLWVRGGFPPSLLARQDIASFEWRRAFIRSYLERDVRDYSPNTSLVTLENFWTMLAHSQGAEWNAARLAAGLGVSGHTVNRYRDLLTDLLLVRQLRPWSGNVGKRLLKSPKVYLRDSGICHALLNITDYEALLGHPVVGASWEAFVVESILNLLPEYAKASFYRTATGDEIDLVLEHPKLGVWAIEIKRSTAPAASAGFYRGAATVGATETWLIYPGTERFPLADGVQALGIVDFLYQLGDMMGRLQN